MAGRLRIQVESETESLRASRLGLARGALATLAGDADLRLHAAAGERAVLEASEYALEEALTGATVVRAVLVEDRPHARHNLRVWAEWMASGR